MSIFNYTFMQQAFLMGLLIAIIVPAIGVFVVLKRLSMLGDAISHSSLAGLLVGLVASINPILTAAAVSVLSALSMEYLRQKFPRYSEISISIVMAASIGVSGILSGFVKNPSDLNRFLFGSIVAIKTSQLITIVVLSFIVVVTLIFLYKELFYATFDEEAARLSGVKTGIVNTIFMVLTSITVSVAAKTVGALIISSLMILPVASAIRLAKSFKQVIAISVAISIFATIIGLFASFYIGISSGGAISIICVLVLIVTLVFKNK